MTDEEHKTQTARTTRFAQLHNRVDNLKISLSKVQIITEGLETKIKDLPFRVDANFPDMLKTFEAAIKSIMQDEITKSQQEMDAL